MMRQSFRLAIHLFCLWAALHPLALGIDPPAPSTGALWRLGPVHAEKFPRVEAVIETGEKLAPGQLTLLEDGRATGTALEVRPFQETGQGLALALALDVSGTMTGPPMTAMKQALNAVLPLLRPVDRVALITFADTWQMEAPFGAPAETLRGKVQSLQTRGSRTELYRGIFQGLRLFNRKGDLPVRRRLLVISDGHNEAEGYTLENVIRLAQEEGIPVDTVGLSRDPNSPHLSNLEKLSELTGGMYAHAKRVEDLEQVFRAGILRLQETPVAAFMAQTLTADGQQHRVGVRINLAGRIASAETGLWLPERQAIAAAPPPSTERGGLPQPAARRNKLLLGAGGLVGLTMLLGFILLLRRRNRRGALPPPPMSPLAEKLPETPMPPPAPWPAASSTEPLPPPASAYQTHRTNKFPEMPDTEPLYETWGDMPGEFEAPIPPPPEAALSEEPARRSPAPLPEPPVAAHHRTRTKIHTEFRPPAPGQPAAVLLAQEGWEAGKSFAIEQSPFWIGTEAENALPIAEDKFLSAYHACIEFREGSLWLHDNNSTNGTFLNEQRVQGTPRALGEGDRLRLGGSIFLLKRAASHPGQ